MGIDEYFQRNDSSSANTYEFTGRENDGTGLYFYRARYYHPTLQRFITQDPVGFNGGDPNLYAYVLDRPTSLDDPSGLRPLTDCEKGTLSPYIPKAYLDSADLHDDGVPWFTPWSKVGITLYNDIFFRPGEYDPGDVGSIALLAHELIHVGQYQTLGMTYLSYLANPSSWETPAEDYQWFVAADLGAKLSGKGTGCSPPPPPPPCKQ